MRAVCQIKWSKTFEKMFIRKNQHVCPGSHKQRNYQISQDTISFKQLTQYVNVQQCEWYHHKCSTTCAISEGYQNNGFASRTY